MRHLQKILPVLSLLLVCGRLNAATYTQVITGAFGSTYTGLTGSVKYSVIDATGTTQIAATTTGVTEELGSDGATGTGTYLVSATFNTTWTYPVRVKWVVTGYASLVAEAVLGIPTSSISPALLTPDYQALAYRARLQVTGGTANPATNDYYSTAGLYTGGTSATPYYKSGTIGTPIYAWTDGSRWYLTTTVPGNFPTSGTSYWQTAASAMVTGTYSVVANGGTGSGTPVITPYGNAVLSSFQPETLTLTGTLSGVPTAAQVATAVWEDLMAGGDFGTASSIGALLNADINATISSRGTSTLTQAQVTGGAYALNTDGSGNVKLSSGTGAGQISLSSGAVTTGTLTATAPSGFLGSDTTSLTAITANLLGATASSYNTAGTIGNKINSGGSGGDPWATLLSAETTSGSFGAALKAFMLAGPTNWLDSGSIASIGSNVMGQSIESGVTMKQMMEIIGAYAAGNTNIPSGTYSAVGNSGTVRVTFSIASNGSRTITISP